MTLRRLRKESGVSGVEVAKALGISSSKVSRLETSDCGVYVDDVEKLLDFYRVPLPLRVELLDVARRSQQRGLLRMNGSRLPSDWQVWIDFEEDATVLLNYEPLMIPGLLQTPEYARSIIRETGHELSPVEVDALVASRMARQGLLSQTKPVALDAIVDQSVLERPFGDPAAHRRQIRHLADVADLPNISIRMVPTEAGMHSGMNGPFVIIRYADESNVVFLENKVSSLYLDEEEHIQVYETTWAELGKHACSTSKTADYLRSKS